jgi:hypothetical protein
MAAGAWSAAAMVAATIANANPFRKEGVVAEPRHFDPYQLFGEPRRRRQVPQLQVRVSQLKNLFDKTTRGQ